MTLRALAETLREILPISYGEDGPERHKRHLAAIEEAARVLEQLDALMPRITESLQYQEAKNPMGRTTTVLRDLLALRDGGEARKG